MYVRALLFLPPPSPSPTISMTFERFIFIGKLVIGNHRILSYENQMQLRRSLSLYVSIICAWLNLYHLELRQPPNRSSMFRFLCCVFRILSVFFFLCCFSNKISMGNTHTRTHTCHGVFFPYLNSCARFEVGAVMSMSARVWACSRINVCSFVFRKPPYFLYFGISKSKRENSTGIDRKRERERERDEKRNIDHTHTHIQTKEITLSEFYPLWLRYLVCLLAIVGTFISFLAMFLFYASHCSCSCSCSLLSDTLLNLTVIDYYYLNWAKLQEVRPNTK